MHTQNIKIDIVIPVYNRRDTTLQGLKSLSRIDRRGIDLGIIVVDDGSTDGTSEAISREFPEVVLIHGSGDLHYAGGTNRGIQAALERGVDYVVTANDDAVFHDQVLQRSLKTIKNNDRAVVGGALLLWDEPHRVFQVDFKWSTWKGGWLQSDEMTVFDLPHEPFEVEGLAGNFVMIPTEAIRECGLMDEKQFPHGWGDIQYFVRMRKHGWKLLVDPGVYVWCEPNTYPPPLHSLPPGRVFEILFKDRRHPLNLYRQYVARRESAPGRGPAMIAFGVFLGRLAANAVGKIVRE